MKSYSFIIACITVLAVACGQKNKNNDAHADHQATTTSTVSKEHAQHILEAYLKIKDALVKSDGDAASRAASELVSIIGSEKEAIQDKIREDAEHIAGTKDITHQRERFITLSDNVYTLIKSSGTNETVIYRDFCPMAADGKGAYWLSIEKPIANPYFGTEMLTCGSVKETIQ